MMWQMEQDTVGGMVGQLERRDQCPTGLQSLHDFISLHLRYIYQLQSEAAPSQPPWGEGGGLLSEKLDYP